MRRLSVVLLVDARGWVLLQERDEHAPLAPGPFHYRVWTAPTTLTDADIVVGEGRQIVFVDPAAVPLLDASESCTHFVTAFLVSPEHADLVAGPVAGVDEGSRA